MIYCIDLPTTALLRLLSPYDLDIRIIENSKAIPGSYWGEPEAGLIRHCLYIQPQTPLHSALHEACHYICMNNQRRTTLHTNAAGDYDEENAVCYLQIILAGNLPGVCKEHIMQNMDDWGYSFRLGSTSAWFEQDAEDSVKWLTTHHIIDRQQQPTGYLRQ